MLSMIIGLIVVVIAFLGLISWWQEFLFLCRGLMPISFLFGGAVAIIAGFTGLSQRKKK